MATEWIPTAPTPCSKAALAGMVFFGALERLASSSIMAAPATLADVAKRGANHTGTVPHITAPAVLAHSPKVGRPLTCTGPTHSLLPPLIFAKPPARAHREALLPISPPSPLLIKYTQFEVVFRGIFLWKSKRKRKVYSSIPIFF
uniref:Uncharacterized protein n=1 Tax=Oryza rufipogon TaxID=4529 RepID=A0A0E0PYD4_ORYRU